MESEVRFQRPQRQLSMMVEGLAFGAGQQEVNSSFATCLLSDPSGPHLQMQMIIILTSKPAVMN